MGYRWVFWVDDAWKRMAYRWGDGGRWVIGGFFGLMMHGNRWVVGGVMGEDGLSVGVLG
ncbi:MAG: hypothetical protein VKK42_30645 [Lyngbya sp.]|nr:hypothetical protein [Lyngbya sp.]